MALRALRRRRMLERWDYSVGREFVLLDFALTRVSTARSILWIAYKVREMILVYGITAGEFYQRKGFTRRVNGSKRNTNLLKGEGFQ